LKATLSLRRFYGFWFQAQGGLSFAIFPWRKRWQSQQAQALLRQRMVPGLKYCKHIPIKNPTLAIIVFANRAPKPTIIPYTPTRKNARHTLCTDSSSAHTSQRILHKIFRALAHWNKFRLVIYKTIRKDIGSLIRMLRLCAFFAKEFSCLSDESRFQSGRTLFLGLV
jgi:hypothetical protein